VGDEKYLAQACTNGRTRAVLAVGLARWKSNLGGRETAYWALVPEPPDLTGAATLTELVWGNGKRQGAQLRGGPGNARASVGDAQ